jgi:hypothetical protein
MSDESGTVSTRLGGASAISGIDWTDPVNRLVARPIHRTRLTETGIVGSSPVNVTEIQGSPVEDWDVNERTRAVVDVKVAWSDRYTFSNWVATTYYSRNDSDPTTDPPMLCRHITIKPFGRCVRDPSVSYLVAYEAAIVTITYDMQLQLSDNQNNPVVFSESIEPAYEFITLKPQWFKWEDGGRLTDHDNPPGLQIRTCNYRLTYYGITSIPNWVFTMEGACNGSSFKSRSLGITFAKESLLYNPPVANISVCLGEKTSWQLEFSLTHRGCGWNKFPRITGGGISFQKILDRKSGNEFKPYPTGDFSGLLI